MNFSVGLENGDENRSVAWILGHPGCFAYGPGPDSAMQAVPGAIRDYSAWIERYNGRSWLDVEEIQARLEEAWDVYWVNEEYERVEQGYGVNAWFFDDWKPLQAVEVERGLALLEWSRADLLETVEGLRREVMERAYPGERWSIDGILKHTASAEWWYMDRLGLAFPRCVLHDDVFERLKKVRIHLNEVLPTLAGAALVKGTDAEFWSPRKLLRRAVWHERDHTQHIKKLLAGGP